MTGIRVELELQSGNFTSRMIHAGETVQQFQTNVGHAIKSVSRMETETRGFLSTLRDLTVITGLAGSAMNNIRTITTGWVGDIVRVNAEVERLTTLMKSMSRASDPAKEAAENVKYLRDMARDAPFSIKALSDSFVKLKSTGIDPMDGTMRSLVDAIAAFGGSEAQMDRAAMAMQQMAGKGVIQMEELRQQLGEAIPRATELMARGMGVSYGELVAAIGTGTVDAKSSLQAMQLEFQRTFGGAALSMMNTFNGQITQTKTLLQEFALNTGNAGFFDSIKQQLMDLNDVLAGPQVAAFANHLGAGLSTVVGLIRSAIDFVVEFRNEIILTGQVMAGAFAAQAAVAGIVGLMRILGTLRAEIAMTGVAWVAMQRQLQANVVASAATAMTGFGTALTSAAIAARFFGTAVATFMPYLTLIAAGIMLVANYFGIFADKARDAYEEIEKFGAATREQVEAARPHLEQLRKDYEAAEKAARELSRWDSRTYKKETIEDRDAKRARLKDAEAMMARAETQARENEARRETEAVLRQAQAEIDVIQRKYDQESLAAGKAYDTRLEAEKTSGRSLLDIQRGYERSRRELSLQRYRDEEAILKGYYERAVAEMKNKTEAERGITEAVVGKIAQRLNDLQNQRRQYEAQGDGIQQNTKAINEEKLLEKGRAAYEAIQSQIAGIQAEMAGATNEAAKLAYQLGKGKFGPENSVEVQILIEKLVEAQRQKDLLDQKLRGRKQLQQELDNELSKLRTQSMELKTEGLNPADRIRRMIDDGFFQGITSDIYKTSDAIDTAAQSTGELSTALQQTANAGFAQLNAATGTTAAQLVNANQGAEMLAKSLQGSTFGTQTLQKGNSLLSIVQQLTGAWAQFRQQVDGTDVKRAFGDGIDPGLSANPFGSFGQVNGLNQSFYGAFKRMMDEAPDWVRAGTAITSGFRSIEQQQKLWEEALKKYGSAEEARKWVAPPGNSQHNRGNAMDLGFTSAAVREWVHQNSGRYGLSFPLANEPWHIEPKGARAGTSAPVAYNNLGGSVSATLDAISKLFNENRSAEFDKVLKEKLTDYTLRAERAGDIMDDLGKREAAAREMIKSGEFGSNKDPLSKRYEDLIKIAKTWDAEEAKVQERQRTRTEAQRARESLSENSAEQTARLQASRQTLANPFTSFADGRTEQARVEMERDLAVVRQFYGERSDIALEAERNMQTRLSGMREIESNEFGAALVQQTAQMKAELSGRSVAAAAEFERTRDRILAWVQTYVAGSKERVLAERIATDAIETLHLRLADQSIFGQQMNQWKKFGENLEQAMTGWLDAGTDALAEFITTGTADFRSFVNSIAADLARLSLRSMFSGFAGKSGLTGWMTGGAGKLTGVAHTGGIVGGRLASRMSSPFAFVDAPRFHTGGIIGADEVPIIARKGEGVFTPEQMSALGTLGGANLTIAPTITVEGSTGSREDNQDLAQRISKEVEAVANAVFMKELAKQKRPGGALNHIRNY